MKPQKNRFIAFTAAFVGFSVPAFAASGTWNTTTTGALWTLDANWVGSVIADGSGNSADFSQLDITADTTVALNGTRTIGTLVFGDTATATAGSWILGGGANALTLAGATPTITVNALGTNKVAQFNTGFTGSSGFTKNGVGTLILSSSGNTLSGPVTLSTGTLQLNSPSLPNASSVAINGGTLVVATTAANALGGTISFGGGGLQYNNAPGTDYSAQFSTNANQAYKMITIGGISTTFASNLASSGGSLRKDGGGNLTLAAANTFTGTTTIGGGNLILSNPLALQNSAIDATNSVTGTASAGLVLSGVTTPTFGGLTGTKALSTLFNSSTGGYGSLTNLTLNPGTGANYTYSATIAEGASGMSLTKSGAGNQTLSGNNSYTGGTAINSGTLVLGSANAIGTSGTISFGGGALKAFNTDDYSSRFSTAASQAYNIDTNGQSVTWASGLTSSGGTLTKSGTGILTLSGGTSNAFDGAIAVNAGTLGSLNSASLQNLAGTITVAPGATFDAKAAFGANIANNFSLGGTGSGISNHGALNIRENANLSGAITLNADTRITHDWNVATVSGSITGTNTSLELKTLIAGQFGFVMSGPINLGTGALTLTGIGTTGSVDFALSGTNSFTGGTLLKGGRVTFNNASAFGSGTVTFVSNTSLTGTANMTHANALTVNSGIAATLGAAASTNLTQSGALTGDGTLTKNGLGIVTLSGGLDNTFTGPVNVDAGTLSTGSGASVKNITGAITVASGATFNANQQFDANSIAQNISIAGNGPGATYGALNLQGNVTLTGAVTLTADSKISHDFNNGTISGAISGTNTNLQLTTLQSAQAPLSLTGPVNLGTGGVTVTGAGGISTINLSGTLNYTGETVVIAGTLKLSGTARMADSSTVRITSGAVVNLDFTGTDTVAALYLGASLMPAGTYGSLASSATNKSANFEGAGILSVGGAPAPSFSTWAAANGIPGQPATGDFDNDGLTNIVEYALGLSPTISSVPPGTFNGSLLSFTKGTEAKANGDVTYEIEQSTTLGGWTVVVPNAPGSATISYTLPSGQPKVFARLKIIQIP